MRKSVLFVATGAGSGYAPIAPGTFGSLVGLVLYFPLSWLGPWPYLGLALAITWGGALVSSRAEAILGRKDDQRITIDEVAGVLLALAFLPPRIDVVVAGFILFRLFDIWKPPPCRKVESLPGGWGVMADDVVAGIYANLCGQLLWRVLWPGGWM